MKKIAYSILVILLVVILTACSSISKNSDGMVGTATPETQNITEDSVETMNQEQSKEVTKIITTASIQLETLDYNKTIKEIPNITSNLKAYINSSNISNNSIVSSNQTTRYASYSIKIPKDSYNKLLEDIKKIGNITYTSTESIDVSNEYRDTEARVKALQIREDRLMELLSKAQNLSDIIKLEEELNNIIYEKEMLTGNLNQINDKVNYTQVNLEIIEVSKYNNQIGVSDSFIVKVKNTFISSINYLLTVLENLVLLIIWILPLMIIFVPLLLVIVYIFKKAKNKLNNKNNK